MHVSRPPGPRFFGLVVLVASLLSGGCRASRPVAVERERLLAPKASRTALDPNVSAEVDALASSDFAIRSHAAEALVARGEAALEALGAAGDLPVEVPGKIMVSATRPVIAEILVSASADRVAHTHLASADAVVRRGAADELGRRGGWGPVPELIERLDDDDASVRAAVVASLRRLTNHVYDVAASDRPSDLTAAAARWREWWTREGRRAAADPAHRSG